MSPDSQVVASDLLEPVRGIVSEVLLVPRDMVSAESALMDELGAESIDFLDMIFRVEDIVGRRIPASRWYEFLEERLRGANLARAITTAIVVEFAERERELASR
jgi:acyl carrier protein